MPSAESPAEPPAEPSATGSPASRASSVGAAAVVTAASVARAGSHPPALLAFDTSTSVVAVAACGPSGEAFWTGPGSAAASANLLPAIHRVLAQSGLTMQMLDVVAFGAGPGAFTGLRTACSVAQGLAFGLGCPVLPLDSLALVAEDAWPGPDGAGRAADADSVDGTGVAAGTEVWVAMDARMDEIYAGAYGRAADGWRAVTPPALHAWRALADRWSAEPPARVAGSAVAAFADRLPWGRAVLVPAETDRPAALLRLARQAWARGEAVPADQALPIYLRDKVAQTTAERLSARAAAVPAP
jgi:tRNA threonylcarbamoyladenosine biosynthesis protein TsaB